MYKTTQTFSMTHLLFMVTLCMVSTLPQLAAASTLPSCTLSIATKYETVSFQKKESVYVEADSHVTVRWSSKGAERAENYRGEARQLAGSVLTIADRKKSFTYFFYDGSKKVSCTAVLVPFRASINSESLATQSHTPTIVGESETEKKLELKVYKNDTKKALYTTKIKSQKDGQWESSIKKKLADGEYTLELLGTKHILARTLAKETLIIGKQAASSKKVDTTFAVETIPLLIGGTTRAGALIPFSYIQVLNIGKKSAELLGFNIAQIGTTPTYALQNLSSVDDTGSLLSDIDDVAGKALFKNNKAFVPAKVTLQPGTVHLFTLKTALTPSASTYLGTQLKLQVLGIETTAKAIIGSFPIRPVTWTVGN